MRVLVVDDEPMPRKRLCRMLTASRMVTETHQAENVAQAIAAIAQTSPQAIFLDVRMPGRSGIDLALSHNDLPPLIFVSGYVEHAVSAFDVRAVDYLVKPVSKERLEKALQRLQQEIDAIEKAKHAKNATSKILLKTRAQTLVIDPLKVSRFYLSCGGFAACVYDGKERVLPENLKALELRVKDLGFFRARATELINLGLVK